MARVLNPDRVHPMKIQTDQILPRVFWTYVAAAGLLAAGMVDFPLLAYHFEGAKISTAGEDSSAVRGRHGGEWIDRPPVRQTLRPLRIVPLVFGILVSLFALPLGFLAGPVGPSRASPVGLPDWARRMPASAPASPPWSR